MHLSALREAKKEAKRFIEKVRLLEQRMAEDSTALYGCAETGAVRRQSMELTRSLARLRKS